jgi:serine/threonine protein kinase
MPREATKNAITNAVSKAFKAVYTLKILYCDAEPHNMLYNAHSGHVIIVDFKRAKLISRKPLGLISLNRKKKHATCPGKQNRNDFAKKLSLIVLSVQRYINQ